MDKKGQNGPLAMIILLIFFVIVWFIFLGGFIGQTTHDAVTDNGITGVEAFAFSNLNLWIFIGLFLGTLGFLYYSSEG